MVFLDFTTDLSARVRYNYADFTTVVFEIYVTAEYAREAKTHKLISSFKRSGDSGCPYSFPLLICPASLIWLLDSIVYLYKRS